MSKTRPSRLMVSTRRENAGTEPRDGVRTRSQPAEEHGERRQDRSSINGNLLDLFRSSLPSILDRFALSTRGRRQGRVEAKQNGIRCVHLRVECAITALTSDLQSVPCAAPVQFLQGATAGMEQRQLTQKERKAGFFAFQIKRLWRDGELRATRPARVMTDHGARMAVAMILKGFAKDVKKIYVQPSGGSDGWDLDLVLDVSAWHFKAEQPLIQSR